MPALWKYPLPPHDYPYYWFILDPKSKQDKVKVMNLKILRKIQILEFCKNPLHMTHFMKLLDMIYMKWIQHVLLEDTEQTQFHLQMDRQKDVCETSIPPFNFVEAGGIMMIP